MTVNEFVIRKYVELLEPIGLNVFTVGAVPAGQAFPYILISDVQVNQRIVYPHKQWVAFGTIEVVTGDKSPIGWTSCLAISEDVDLAINNGVQHKANGYIMHSTYQQNALTIPEQGQYGYVYRNIMSYIHQVSFGT